MKLKSESEVAHFRVGLLATLWTAAHQAPPSMGVSRQEYWSGSPMLQVVPSSYRTLLSDTLVAKFRVDQKTY